MAQTKVGWRAYVATTTTSTLWNSVYAAYNAESNTNDALNTYNGTPMGGLTYGVGKVGTAFQFNGTTSYVQLGDVMDIGTSSWSYSMWFNTGLSTTYQDLFTKTLAAGLTGRFAAYLQDNKIKFFLDINSGYANIGIQTVNTISINTWYNVVFVVDRTDKLKIYLNGTRQTVTNTGPENNLTPYTSTNFNTNNPFRIGAYTDSNNVTALPSFNGKIDAFNVWNRVLTQSEITELYNSGNGKQYPN